MAFYEDLQTEPDGDHFTRKPVYSARNSPKFHCCERVDLMFRSCAHRTHGMLHCSSYISALHRAVETDVFFTDHRHQSIGEVDMYTYYYD